jgi:mannose-6-phosphate isomerase-like protein (cupin superfamily)
MRSALSQPAVVDLSDVPFYLSIEGLVRPRPRTGMSTQELAEGSPTRTGCTLVLKYVREPADVHYPVWEMHTAGDELLILVSGALVVELRLDGRTATTALVAESAFVVPAGVWHRLIVCEPSVLIAITPRHGTRHTRDRRDHPNDVAEA